MCVCVCVWVCVWGCVCVRERDTGQDRTSSVCVKEGQTGRWGWPEGGGGAVEGGRVSYVVV